MPQPESNLPPRRVSEDLQALLQAAQGGPMRVGDIVSFTHGRGLQMVPIILCLPFLSPVSVPFLSIPFGLAIAICAVRIALREHPWLPAFVLNRNIPYAALRIMLTFGIRLHLRLEKVMRPRWPVLAESRAGVFFAGFAMLAAAIILSLPIPPPFPLTNTIPGFAIILLCLGLIERDGIVIFMGHVLTFIGAAYVIAIALIGKVGLDYLWQWFTGSS